MHPGFIDGLMGSLKAGLVAVALGLLVDVSAGRMVAATLMLVFAMNIGGRR
jgi:uncharacterized membrane protein YpjA